MLNAQEGLQEIPVDRASTHERAFEVAIVRQALAWHGGRADRRCRGWLPARRRLHARKRLKTRGLELSQPCEIVGRHHAAVLEIRVVGLGGGIGLCLGDFSAALKRRMGSVDPAVHHRPANALARDVEQAVGGVRLDRRPRAPQRAPSRTVAADHPQQRLLPGIDSLAPFQQPPERPHALAQRRDLLPGDRPWRQCQQTGELHQPRQLRAGVRHARAPLLGRDQRLTGSGKHGLQSRLRIDPQLAPPPTRERQRRPQ